MPNPVPAAATGLPTRRTALTALAGMGAAFGLPAVALAAGGAVTPHPEWDSDLIAHARQVEALAAQAERALQCLIRLDRKAEALKPPRPGRLAELPAWQAACDAVEHRCGLHAAHRITSALDGRLTTAAISLGLMPASTREGMAAKTQACAAVFTAYRDAPVPGWLHTLVMSTLNDALAIGGAA